MAMSSKVLEQLRSGYSWYKWGHGLVGFIPAPLLAVIVGYLGYIGKVSPFLLAIAVIIAFTCGIIIWRSVPAGRQRYQAVGTIIILALIPVCIQMVQLRQKAENFELHFDGITAGITEVRLPDGSAGINAIQIKLRVSNPNEFQVYHRIVSHDTRVAGHDSGLYGEPLDPMRPIAANGVIWVIDDPITLPNMSASKGLTGNVNFVIEYGRDPKRLDKKFEVKGPITAIFYPDGSLFDVLWDGPPATD